MRRVLFVDDEQNILDGLRDLLRKERKRWDMVFALGGTAAMAEMEKGTFDVIVSDMRMPGMDGAALLAHVREHHPKIARIILSGHAEREAVVRALPVAHQFLSKPCDADRLRVVVERACELQALLQDEGLRGVVGKLDKLPSVPQTFWELTQAASNPDVGIADLARIVEKDPAMSVKVLQLVNSAYFGLAKQISSVQQAVGHLGAEMVRALALTVHAFDSLPVKSGIDGFNVEGLQRHSLLTARIAKKLVANKDRANDAFTSALVHDIGKIILLVAMPERFAEIARVVRESKRPFHVVEKELAGVTHAEIGAYLLGVWGLPLTIVEAVAHHHSPGMVGEGPVDVLAAVHVADALATDAKEIEAGAPDEDEIDLAFLERAGLLPQLPAWRAVAAAERSQEGRAP